MIFAPNSGYIARYAPFIWHKSPTNCDAHLSESNFQTRSSVGAVAFRDINDDGKSDIIVIVYYYSGAGPTGMVPRPDIRIFIAEENEFYLAEDMAAYIGKRYDY